MMFFEKLPITDTMDMAEWWMRSSRVLERLTANVKFATVLDSIPAYSDTLESEGRQIKQYLIKYNKNSSEPVLLNVYGAPELIPRNKFRQPM
jgi:hypothetical protein